MNLPTPPLSPSVAIRKAGTDDVQAVVDIFNEYFESIDVTLRDDAQSIAAFLDDPSHAVWVAVADERVRGCVMLRPLTALPGNAECKRMYVAPSLRGHGVADALLQALEDEARQRQYRAVYLDSRDDLKSARRLYLRRGYVDCDRYNDNPQATVFMMKALG